MSNEIAAASESAGAALPPAAATTPPPAPKFPFVVVQQPVLEEGEYVLKNQVVQLTAERAAQLGDQVKPFIKPEPKVAPGAPPPVPGLVTKPVVPNTVITK